MTNIRRQRGLSLIELMISITLGLIILTAIALVFVNASNARTELERVSRQIENGRYAIDVLTSDLRLAGFYGELDVAQIAGSALPDPCSTTASDWNTAIPVHLQGYDDSGFTSANCPLTNLKAGTDVLVVRRVRTCVAGAADCSATPERPYFQVSLCATDPGTGALGTDKHALALLPGDAAFSFRKKACGTTVADKRQYYVHVYYISTDNGAGQTIPTLNRYQLEVSGGAAQWRSYPIVEGIEALNLEYGIDQDGDGAPDVYTADPNDYPVGGCAATSCKLNNWMNVVTVQMHLLARNLEASSDYSDTKTYNLGVDKNGAAVAVTPVGPTDNKYRRHVYSGLVRIANISNRRDRP